MKVVVTVVSALALLAPNASRSALTAAEGVGAEGIGCVRFPTPPRGMSLAWQGKGPSVPSLLDAYARATGRMVLLTERTRDTVRKQVTTIESGTGRLDVRPEDVHGVFETLLRANDLVLSEVFDGTSLSAVCITTTRGWQWPQEVRRVTAYVPPDCVEAYRAHPAVMLTTWVPVSPAIDGEFLWNALRSGLPASEYRRVALVGHGLALMGFGPDVCKLVDFVREVESLVASGTDLVPQTLRALFVERFSPPAEEPK